MAVKYRVNGKYGGYVEYLDISEIPEGAIYEEIQIIEVSNIIVPNTISQRQLRTQLILNNGINLSDIQDAIDSLPEPNKSIAQVSWDYAITFERDSALLNNLGLMLGLNDSDIDNIFINASQL